MSLEPKGDLRNDPPEPLQAGNDKSADIADMMDRADVVRIEAGHCVLPDLALRLPIRRASVIGQIDYYTT
jgi:hypothetical protein